MRSFTDDCTAQRNLSDQIKTLRSNVQAATQTVNKLQYGFRFCFQDGFHHQLALSIQDGGRDGCLVNIEPNIL
ncbi:MAG: hypothetical protein DMG52_02890 [Acidobacteria bacterium]|nr:MAG: hypothetical protein DMG52_02890 [Acidobacteriota bacterium]